MIDNTINGRTPEEIKRGLECCSVDGLSCSNCSYCVSCDADIHALERDALALIQQLEHNWDELFETAKQLERERDAAVMDCEKYAGCGRCAHLMPFRNSRPDSINYTLKYSPCYSCRNGSNWKWRGIQEVE